jgi:hypothetical protein
MFAAAFPIASVAGLINNWAEIRVDAAKILKFSRRPNYFGCEDIGTWCRLSLSLSLTFSFSFSFFLSLNFFLASFHILILICFFVFVFFFKKTFILFTYKQAKGV